MTGDVGKINREVSHVISLLHFATVQESQTDINFSYNHLKYIKTLNRQTTLTSKCTVLLTVEIDT